MTDMAKKKTKEKKKIENAVTEIKSKKKTKKEEVELTSTGSDIFDLIGGGGLPWGRLVNIVGDNSTGKTLLASEIIATAEKKYGKKLKWFYDDAEAGYTFNSSAIWGVDIVAEDDECSETIEDFELRLDTLLNKMKPDERLIYVLDSFDSLTTEDEKKDHAERLKAIEKGKKAPGSYGTSKSKRSSELFRIMKRKIKDKNCLLIVVSQVRENIGVMFGAKYARMGGKALDFYSAQIFWLAVAEKHGKKGMSTGISIKILNSKNKIGKPYRTGIVEILFDYGVDNLTTNINFLYDLKTSDKGKYKPDYDKKKLIWQGREFNMRRLIKHIESNDLEDLLTKQVYEKWQDLEDKANMSKGRKKKF